MSGPVLRAIGPALLVAAGYYLAGKLSLLLAIPPGYASAAWPPAGIALAGVLLGGMRVVPGILLGSFLLNLGTGFVPSALLASYGVPAAIALGAAAQAALGAWLIRRRGYPPNLLTAGTDVIPLMVIGGPVVCTLNATVAVGTLWLAGRVPDAVVPYNWLTWWVGDSIGVLLFAPLVLVWSVRPWRQWLRRQVYVTAPLALLFAVVVALFVFISRREASRIELGFQALASDIHQTLRVRLDNTLAVLASVEGLYAGGADVSPEAFEGFALRPLRNLEGATTLSWHPREAEGARASRVPPEAFAPRAGSTVVDAASEPARRATMEQARDTGQAAASAPLPLAPNGDHGLIVVLPVYTLGAPVDTVEARRRHLMGYAVATFSLEGLFGGLARRAAASGLSLSLSDLSELGDSGRLFGVAPLPRDLTQEFAISFAQRTWRLQLALPEQSVVARRSWEAWVVLAGGLMLVVLLGVLLLAGVGHAAQVEKVVADRTDALRSTGAQLVRSNRELEQYAYVTSHDLKAPLRTIDSFAQLLSDRHGDKLDGEAREFIGFIRSGAGRMQELIDDLLALSRVDARKLDAAPQSMRVAVDRACAALAADIEASHAHLRIGELPFVRGDLHMLGQVWQNLIANAIKFQRPGHAPEIRISAIERPSEWVFSIRDNGIGIAPAHREQVFMVFRRLHTAEQYGGTGIGLAICKKVVQLHGGEIWVEPGDGPGTTLRFTLPKAGPAG